MRSQTRCISASRPRPTPAIRSAPSSASPPTSNWCAWRCASGSSRRRISEASQGETCHAQIPLVLRTGLCNTSASKISDGEKHMPAILGSGEHRYRVVENFAKLPDGWSLTDAASVAVDSKDRVYVFNRGDHPMVVLDREGNFIS